MLRHVVFFKFKDSAEGGDKQANMSRVKKMLEALVGRVPTLVSMSAGPNAVESASAWDFALVAEFADADGLQAYTVHPEHKKVSEFVSKVRTERASVDFLF